MVAYFEKITPRTRRFISILIATLIAIVVTRVFAYLIGWIESVFNSSIDKQYLAKAILILVLFVIGMCICSKAMKLFSAKNLRRYAYLALIPLTTVILTNPIGSFTSHDYSQVQVIGNLLTSSWEEVLFRGFLIAIWARICGLDTGFKRLYLVLLTSFLFGFMHSGQTTEQFIMRSGLGAMFAMVVLQTQTLLLAIILHFLNNSASNILQGTIDPTTQLICIILLSIFSLVIVYKGENTDSRLNVLDSELQEITFHP